MYDIESTVPFVEEPRPETLKQKDLELIRSRSRQQVRRSCFIDSCDEPSCTLRLSVKPEPVWFLFA